MTRVNGRETCLIVAIALHTVNTANVMLISLQAHSHMQEGLMVGEELKQRGHNVYVALSSVTKTPAITQEVGINVIRYRSRHVENPFTSLWMSAGHVNASLYYSEQEAADFFGKVSAVAWDDCKYDGR